MNDDDKKFPRKGAGKPAGRGRRPDGPRTGKPDFGKKPFRAGGAKKPFVKKPVAERADGTAERSTRQFERAARPRDDDARTERGARPFKAGPRPDRKPFEKRDRPAGERKPYAERGERKPYSSRSDGAERPKREFRRDDRPRGNEGKPNAPRAEREQRFQRREDPAAGGGATPRRDGARSFGTKSHEGPRRSQGMKSHGDAAKRPFARRAEPVEETTGERIAKRLARAGIASRRDAEDLIAAGRVTVNGRKLDSPAFNVTPSDRIEVDGTEIPAIERTRLFLFHKPAGVVTTNRDPEGRKTVFDVLPADLPRLMTIGRLDINTEGLLLLTNDGGLARVLELPATGWLRRYRVRVHGKVEEKALAGLKEGIAVDGVFYGAVEASLDREQGTNAWLTIGLREGKNREVKNILGALGLDVTRLIRISYGPFQLGDLPEGHVLEIKGRMLRDQLGERLIEESGANFEAPVVSHFPNQPVRRDPSRTEEPARPKARREGERGAIGEGGLIKKRHRREDARDTALGKLSTRPDREGRPAFGERADRGQKFDRGGKFGDKSGPRPARGGKAEREQRPVEPPGQRKSNVWMAPGARPIGAGRAATEKAEAEAKRAAKKPYGKAGGKPAFGKTRFDKPTGGRPQDRPRGDRPGGGKGGPRGKDADRRR